MSKRKPEAPWRPPESFVILESRWATLTQTLADAHGQCNPRSNTIIISEDEGAESVAEVWFHELGHACWSYTALGELFTDEQEEQVIASLMPILFATLKRNGLAFGD